MRRRRERLKEMQQRLQLTAYVPPASAVDIAQERTADQVAYFREFVRNVDFLRAWDALECLARSCYLQGVTDAAQAMVRKERTQ